MTINVEALIIIKIIKIIADQPEAISSMHWLNHSIKIIHLFDIQHTS